MTNEEKIKANLGTILNPGYRSQRDMLNSARRRELAESCLKSMLTHGDPQAAILGDMAYAAMAQRAIKYAEALIAELERA